VPGPGGGTDLRSRIAAGEILGPRMFTAGRLIDLEDGRRRPFAVEITSVAEVRAEVRRQAAAGVDWVKFYNKLSPELLLAGIEEARAAGELRGGGCERLLRLRSPLPLSLCHPAR
jgi:hypothetical protein